MKMLLSALLALGCASCSVAADKAPENPLYEPFLNGPTATPGSPNRVTLAYFDMDGEAASSISLATANEREIKGIFSNFLIGPYMDPYGSFYLKRGKYNLVSWSATRRALSSEGQVVELLDRITGYVKGASFVTSEGFGFITKHEEDFDYLNSIIAGRFESERVSGNCVTYRHQPKGAKHAVTGFVIRDEDGVLDLYDTETIDCVGQFLARSMGLTVSHEQILALTGFDQQTDRGRPQQRTSTAKKSAAVAAEDGVQAQPQSAQPSAQPSRFPTVMLELPQEELDWLAEGGCILASVLQRPVRKGESRLAYSGCPTAPSVGGIAFPYFVYGMGSGENESPTERAAKLREICREYAVSDSVAQEYCQY